MTGGAFLDATANRLQLTPTDPLDRLPSTFDERFEAEWSAAFSPDRYFRQTASLAEKWDRAIDDLHRRTGQRLENPYSPTLSQGENTKQAYERRRNAGYEAFRLAREQFPELPDPELFERQIALESTRRREDAANLVGTGNGFGAFAGGMAAETFTPHGIAGFFVPVTRLPTLVASRTLMGAAANIGREAAFQAAANVALQVGAEGADYLARAPLGTEQTAEEIGMNLAGAAVFGAAFGGGVRAGQVGLRAVLGRWHGLAPDVRDAAPRDVRDAINVLTRDELDGIAGNPLGDANSHVHERIKERVTAELEAGRIENVGRVVQDEISRAVPVFRSERLPTADEPRYALLGNNEYLRLRDGSFDFGALPAELAAKGIEPGPIRVPRGDANMGEAHVIGRPDRLAQLQRHGYEGFGELVDDVSGRYTEIYRSGETLLLVAPSRTGSNSEPMVYLQVAHRAGEKWWDAQSGGVFRDSYAAGGGKALLWHRERTPELPPGGAEPLVPAPLGKSRSEAGNASGQSSVRQNIGSRAGLDNQASKPEEVAQATESALKNRKLDEALRLRLDEALAARPDLAVPVIGGDGVEKSVPLKKVLADLDKQEGDVNAALGCILGGLL